MCEIIPDKERWQIMKTDFVNKILDIPSEDWVNEKLAYEGGKPVIPTDLRKTKFPVITKEDMIQMMVSIQKNEQEVIDEFTEKYKEYVGANYALSTSSGTSSLHLALIGAGVEPGDEVIVPAFTFIATAQAVVAAKAIPVFVDIDPKTYCLDPSKVESAISKRTKVIMPVHVHGLPADLDALREICDKHHLKLVEDASHAHSASYHGKICGSIGDAAGQSLMADKNFPVGGEGGIVFFKEKESYDRVKKFLEKTGIDYNMSWIAAAFGISQLERLPHYDAIRQRNAKYLSDELSKTKLFTAPYVPENCIHSYNMFRVKIHPEEMGLDNIEDYKVKEAIHALLLEEGLFAREWQNMPVPGHLPFKNRIGFGNGYPFILSEREELGYSIYNFPETLNMIRSTLVICRELRSPIEYERIQAYALAFMKIAKNPEIIRDYAQKLSSKLPYEGDARLG